MLVSPVPSVFQELVASKVAFLDALLCQSVYDLSLCCDRCVVCSRNPAGILAVETCLADKDILDSIVKHVSHVKHTCNIWWRDNDGVRFATIGLAAEKLVVKPVLIPFFLYFRGIVFAC